MIDKHFLGYLMLLQNKGMKNAQYMVGLFYQQGFGILSDLTLAAYWYDKAASTKGMDNAQLLALGIMYSAR